MNQQNIPPSMRTSKRYVRVKVRSDKELGFEEFLELVWDGVIENLGTMNASKLDMWVIKNKFSKEKQQGVVRVNRDLLDDFVAAIVLINDFEGFLEVRSISGSLKSLDG